MKSLLNFPEDFQPLVIVTGDRREIPPQSKGDMLAYSVSVTDFMYINNLNINDSLILSDKVFAVETEKSWKEKFGNKNILVIGSPAVNLLARRINKMSKFRFDVSDETEEELREQDEFMKKFIHDEDDLFIYQQCLDGIVEIRKVLDRFKGFEPNIFGLQEKAEEIVPEFMKTRICQDLKANPRPIRYLMHKLDKPGIFDSLSGTVRGSSISPYKDYGLLAILRNPFNEVKDYWIVYVAGVHGPGTALGVKLLSNKDAFRKHPYGGVYEVLINRFANYFDKFQESKARWETPPYKNDVFTPRDWGVKGYLKIFLSSPGGTSDEKQKLFNKKLIELVKDISTIRGISLEIEQPYTIPLGLKHNFWESILDYQQDCNFILHDMTNCARGVMVEIGFSYGKKKQHFLIWNLQKRFVNDLKEMNIPSLLPVKNIERIDLSDTVKAKEILDKKIIDKVLPNSNDCECNFCEAPSTERNIKGAYVYSNNEELSNYLDRKLSSKDIINIDEKESDKELRICQICEVLRMSDFAFIEIVNDDLNSFIILGMAKAIGVKTFLISLERYKKADFLWAKDIVTYRIGKIPERLNTHLDKFLNF